MYKRKNSILDVTSTICQLMEIKKPKQASTKVFEKVIKQAKKLNIEKIEKVLVFAPDAVGEFLQKDYSNYFDEVKKYAPISLKIASVFKPVTPVCFASMFTGALPTVHGIKKYEKPVIKIDTIFDSLIEENKKTTIVSVKNSSIDLIFRNRNLDYYSEKYDKEVIEKTIELLKKDKYDFILAYNQEYDDSIHDTYPLSEKSLIALKNQNSNFVKLAKAFNELYFNYNRAIIYTPDHGCHINENGFGDHGENIKEDMNIIHFWGIFKANEFKTSYGVDTP
ncbi:MAG: hypothetical protein U0457_00195 [Candidatus Sericytochromatia bacterium]